MYCSKSIRGVERLHLEVQLLDKRHREGPQVREISTADDRLHPRLMLGTNDVDAVIDLRREVRNE